MPGEQMLQRGLDIIEHPIASIIADPFGTPMTAVGFYGIGHGAVSGIRAGVRGIADMAAGRELPAQEAADLNSAQHFQEQAPVAPTPEPPATAEAVPGPIQGVSAQKSEQKPSPAPVPASESSPATPVPRQEPVPPPQAFADMMIARAAEHGHGVEAARDRVRQSYDAWLDKSDEEQAATAAGYGMTPQQVTEHLKQTLYHIDRQVKAPEDVVTVDKQVIHDALFEGPKNIQELIDATGYPPNRIMAQMTMGELAGELVRGDDGGYRMWSPFDEQAKEHRCNPGATAAPVARSNVLHRSRWQPNASITAERGSRAYRRAAEATAAKEEYRRKEPQSPSRPFARG